jgi:TRAP-type C4-dicarboxylate transport system substrate-binding protein
LADVFTALQTGLVDTVGNTMAGAIALQWHTRVAHVFDLPVTYVVGYVAIDRKAYERMDDADRHLVSNAFAQAASRIDAANRRSDAEARAVMMKQGVSFVAPSAEETEYWSEIGRKITAQLVQEGSLDADVLAAVRAALPGQKTADSDRP